MERVRRAGVTVIGKTNVPEFAAGSHTFNTIFGTTLNPVDPTRSAGGSSGGAACALASGMVPLADGSDMGGSLRNPASFCGVVGLRPSLGRVPQWPAYNQWETTSVGGPMARNVGDLALLLSVIAGPDPRAPQALGEPGATFAPPVSGSLSGLRVALSVDLGGAFEVDHGVAAVVESAGPVLASAGATVSDAYPSLPEAEDTFRTLRAWHFQAVLGDLLAENPHAFKPSLADNIRAGVMLTGADVATAYANRTALSERMREFFGAYDVLVLPAAQVPPFPADQEFPTAINGRPMATYLDWMRACYLITVTGCPAISVPFGTTPDGLPVGIQIVAPHGRDRFLLEVAAAVEEQVEGASVTAEFRPGIPAFVQVYDRLRELIARDGLEPGERLPSEVVLAGELGVTRELVHESLLLLEEDGHLVRDRARRWCVAAPAGRRIGFADGFHRQLGGAVPVRRLHAAVEDGSTWSRDLLGTDQQLLVWETVFAVDGRLLASALELMPVSALPEDVVGATGRRAA